MKVHIIYDDTTGDILDVRYGVDGPPPVTPGPGRKHLVTDPVDPLPTPATHYVDVAANPDTLTAKTQQQQDDAANAQKKADLERTIGSLTATKKEMDLLGYSSAAVQAEIDEAIAQHAALP